MFLLLTFDLAGAIQRVVELCECFIMPGMGLLQIWKVADAPVPHCRRSRIRTTRPGPACFQIRQHSLQRQGSARIFRGIFRTAPIKQAVAAAWQVPEWHN